MAYLQLHDGFRAHPKVKRLCAILRDPRAWSYAVAIWDFARLFAQDGRLDRFEGGEIEAACDWAGDDGGLINALVTARLLDRDGASLIVHDWQDWGGAYFAQRAADAERKRVQRRPPDVHRTAVGQARPSGGRRSDGGTSRVDQRRSEESTDPECAIPDAPEPGPGTVPRGTPLPRSERPPRRLGVETDGHRVEIAPDDEPAPPIRPAPGVPVITADARGAPPPPRRDAFGDRLSLGGDPEALACYRRVVAAHPAPGTVHAEVEWVEAARAHFGGDHAALMAACLAALAWQVPRWQSWQKRDGDEGEWRRYVTRLPKYLSGAGWTERREASEKPPVPRLDLNALAAESAIRVAAARRSWAADEPAKKPPPEQTPPPTEAAP